MALFRENMNHHKIRLNLSLIPLLIYTITFTVVQMGRVISKGQLVSLFCLGHDCVTNNIDSHLCNKIKI